MDNIKIGFIQATNEMDVHWFKPLAFGYLKAYLMRNIDFPFEMDFIEPNNIDISGYSLVGISSTSQDYGRAIKIASDIKRSNPEVIIVIGGHHITYMPETITKDFDIGVIGEGEETFSEIVKLISEQKGQFKKADLRKIKGIVFHGDNGIEITERRDLIRPLDRIPHPVRSLEGDQYIFTSRGCPYRCSFCSSSSFWDKTRMFSAEYVVKEIEMIVDLFPEIKHITVEDDLFVLNLERFKKIGKLLDKKGLSDKLKFSFSIRANLVDDDFCKTIKAFNIESVYFGAESASDRILKILKKGTTVLQNQKALDILQKHNIPCVCSFIIGVPSETEEEVRQTYEFLINNLLDGKLRPGSPVNILMPMPGTKIWDDALRTGLIDMGNFDWNRLSIFASYRHSSADTFDEWVKVRKQNRSIYLNQETLDEDRLYEIMWYYEEKIKKIEQLILNEKNIKKEYEDFKKGVRELIDKINGFKEAIPVLEDITKLVLRNFSNSLLLNKTGELCYHLDLSMNAYNLFKKALINDPENDEILNNLGAVSIKIGEFDSAKWYFEQALSINPNNLEAQQNLLYLLTLIEGKSLANKNFTGTVKQTVEKNDMSGM